jgi:hypothetical protein
MRPSHKNRSRSRHRSSGGGGGGGGNPLSRVYESNGPDVKVRGTAQTVADKYLQLGRDAQSSGDIVMAESYFQHAEHYLRIVTAAQAYNQQMQQQHRRQDEEFDDEDLEDSGDASVEPRGIQPQAEADGTGEQPLVEGAERPPQQQPNQGYRQPRDDRYSRDSRDQGSRDQQQRDRFKPRWQDRRGDAQPAQGGEQRQPYQPSQPRNEEQPRIVDPAPAPAAAAESGKWEAPSFLRRPAPAPAERPAAPVERPPAAEAPAETPPASAAEAPAPALSAKRKYERRPRKDAAADAPAADKPPVTESAGE